MDGERAGRVRADAYPRCRRELQKFEAEAIKVLKETGADHVLYGVKEYDSDGDLDTVRFYLEPMSEQEFEDRVVKNSAGMTVYAVHKR